MLTFGVAALTYLVVHVVSSLMIDSDLHIHFTRRVKPHPFSKRGDLHVCPHLSRVDAGQIFLKKFSATCSQYGTLER